MIELKVEPYCHNCPDFEEDIRKETFHSVDELDFLMRPITISETVITCTKAHRCANQVRYLKKEIEKNANVGT